MTVTRIGHLAGSTFDVFGIITWIGDAQFPPPAKPPADAGTSTGRLTLAMFGGLADVECELTAEGRNRQGSREAHRATRRGGKRLPDGAQGATLRELARSYNVVISTIRRATRAIS